MLRKPILAALLVALSAGAARAQVSRMVPGYYRPTAGAVMQYDLSIAHEMQRNNEIDRQYRAALSKIPNKKPPADPWASVRNAPPPDKHGPE
jgi:hypothetical protein